MGLIPIIPHKISSHWDKWGLLTHWTHGQWIHKFCLPLLSRCDIVLFVRGWQDSAGARIEYAYAGEQGIRRCYSVTELEGLV